MRKNLPVTQHEFALPPGTTLVSVTDLKGRITYCNQPFVAVSGFSRDELIGQPHNLVRHPDMPEEAFRDLWDTIQAGLPWTGIVKNRRKNGDHYWVLANATPMKNGERIVGYLSVRSAPSRAAVERASAIYGRMHDEARRGRRVHALVHGRIVRRDLRGRLAELLRLPPVLRLAMVLGALAGAAAAAATYLPTGLAAVSAAVAVGLATWAAWTALMGPSRQVIDDALHLAAGDLSHAVEASGFGTWGRLQLALQQVAVNLRTVVHDTRTELESLRAAAGEIARGNQDLSRRTESQAASLEQTAAAMEQLNGAALHSARALSDSARLAQSTAGVSERGHEAVQGVAIAMDGISTSSRSIGEIVEVIDSVAFQTNILALNAAVEAARAGTSGSGFAVVATEVRALAQRVQEAARQIRGLVEESGQRVKAGDSSAAEAMTRVSVAMEQMIEVRRALDTISHATNEQQHGITQINDAVNHMDGLTQQNAAMVVQLAAAAGSLEARVQAVTESMQLFRLAAEDRTLAERDAVSLRRTLKEGVRPIEA